MSDPVEEAAKLPLNQRLEHSHWKVRSVAYEELAKKYNEALESTSSIYNEYSGFFKKMMNDKNAAAMEKGLEPIYAFYDRYDHASKFTASLAPLIIEKCLGARQGTKQRATEVLMLMVEVDTSAEAVVVALVEGASNKVPKVAITSIQTLELIVKTFGVKVVPLKPILATFLPWFDHTNAEARAAAQTFTIELYRWVGGVILDKPIANLRQAQVTELQKAFADIVKGAAVPEKYLRCQVDQMQAAAAAGAGAGAAQPEEVDVYTMVEAVNLISKITPDMYEMLHSKKWKDKKETLEAINKIADTPRLATGEYGELVKNLKRLLGDANVFVVEESVKLLGFCARGLRADFSHFAKSTMGALLDKLKEKKDKVIAALQGTFDAYHPQCFALADVTEDILVASKHKVPQVKKELLNWLKRALPKEKRNLLTKSLKTWCMLFMELMDDSDSPVRENAFECFGLLIGMLGERSLTGYINQLDKVKEKRVREFIPSAPIPPPAAADAASSSAPAVPTIDVNANVNLNNVATKKGGAKASSSSSSSSSAPAPATKKSAAAPKSTIAKPVSSNTASSAAAAASTASSSSTATTSSAPSASAKPAPVETFNPEPRMNAAEAESRVTDYVPDNLVTQLGDKDWKQRLDAMSVVASMVERWDANTATENAEGLLLFLVVARPSFKEPNVQVLAKMTEVLKRLCSVQRNWNKNDVYVALAGVVDHIHEAKLTVISLEFLNTLGENPSLGIQFVFNALYGLTKEQKAPKVIVESMAYMSTALSEFGGSLIEMRNLVTFIKTVALEHTNATIKATGIRVLCEVHKHMGLNVLMPLLSDVRPQLMTTIKKEFEKIANDRPATPTRGPNGPGISAATNGAVASSSSSHAAAASGSAALADIPRVDISNQINTAIAGFTNNDWQKRQEAMASIESAIIEARRIQPKGLSSLMMPLKARLADSNINLIPLALSILGEVATATGPTIESHMKTVMPSILACYANGKNNVKTACSLCLDKWVNEVGLDPLLPYLPTALGTPSGRADLLGWISTKLGYVKKGDVKTLLKPALQCYQDKTKEVRAVAETTIIELARRLTPKVVEGECSKLAPAVLTQVRTLLKNNEAEIKKPVAVQQVGQSLSASKLPVPSNLTGLPSAPSPVASPRASEVSSAPAAADSSKPASPAPPAGPVLRNNKRMDRELEELAWIFDSPVPAKFVDALREQAAPCMSPDLLDRLFSNDAKSHNSAIADLQTCVDSHQAAVQDSLDVILKWCSLRLFSPNAAIVKRVVELIENLIGSLDIWDHKLSELEAASFIPILVIRLPHLNESQQTSLRSILQSVEQTSYPASKIFKLFMETHRLWTGSQIPPASRVECLRYLAAFIRRQSLSVCEPSEAFRVFSGLLSEENPAVVTATLDVFAEAGKKLQEDESLWAFISPEHHDLVRAYIASPTPETLAKFSIGAAPVATAAPATNAPASSKIPTGPAPSKIPTGPVASAPAAAAPAAAAEPSPAPTAVVEEEKKAAEKPKEKPAPVLEKVSISKSAQFSLDLDKLSVEPLPTNLDIKLPPGVSVTLLPSHITADPTPFLPSRQVSRTSADAQAQAQAQKQSQLMVVVQGWISQLKSSDAMVVIETLKAIHSNFSQDLRVFAFHIDPLLSALASLLKSSFMVLSSSPYSADAVSQMRMLLIDVVSVLFKDENRAQWVPESQIRVLLPLLIESMLNANELPITQPEREALIAQANGCTVAVLNVGNRTATLVTLLSQLREKSPRTADGSAPQPSASFLDVIKKCLTRATKSIPTNLSKLALPTILYEIHLFFATLPPHTWPREANTALEVVKGLLDKLVQVAGSAIVNHLGLVPAVVPPPAINWYLKTFLAAHSPGSSFQSLAAPDVDPETQAATVIPELAETSTPSLLAHMQPKPALPSPEYRLPAPAGADAKRQALTHVFQKISKKETSQQGLVDLYWLKKEHPDVEVEEFIRSTSAAFKSFISQHMKRLAALETLTTTPPNEILPRETIHAALQPAQDANAQLSRLRSLQSRLKLGKPTEAIVQAEIEPSMLSTMASSVTGASSSGHGSSSAFGGSSSSAHSHALGAGGGGVQGAAGKPIASISGYRERLKNVSSQAELSAPKFELPSLTVPTTAPTSAVAPSQPSSYALPSLASETISAPRPATATTSTTTTAATTATAVPPARVAPSSSQIPSGPSVPSSASSGSSVESLRERLARIKGAAANPAS